MLRFKDFLLIGILFIDLMNSLIKLFLESFAKTTVSFSNKSSVMLAILDILKESKGHLLEHAAPSTIR